ncbi:MAG: OmpA family protein [Prevotella sp.]|jgi:outer membrane protein OmpA-like peptidoglycan-associated protein|nr:OmpA family protein [Prevotella sp.]MBO7129892.1 OmpA family protein [Prevotella sp.]
MKMKKTILSCLLALGFLTASAQDQQPKTEYVFEPHWYVQIQPLGVQYTLGERDFGDLLSYNVQAALGRQFTPVIGARLAVNAWQSKAGSKIDGWNFDWKWKYVAPSVDVTFNLSNLFCGFNPNRLFNFSVFGGLGANIGFSNDEAKDARTDIMNKFPSLVNTAMWDQADNLSYLWDGTKVRLFGQAGIAGDFRISDAVSVGLELSANTLSDKYNSKKAGNWDWYFNALAGVKINLGPTYTTREIPVPEPEIRYVEKIVEKIVEKPAPAPAAAVAEVEPLRRDIFFLINKTNIRPSEAQKVKDIADYLNEHPTAKVMITGYADAGTGNNKINDRLAAGRADAVVKSLKKDYGIAESRISYDSKGSRVQPFAENDMNRVSICVAE